jgi:hypothetical protein
MLATYWKPENNDHVENGKSYEGERKLSLWSA